MTRFARPLRSTGDLVPLVDRMRSLAWWRLAVFTLAAVVVLVMPSASRSTAWPYALASLSFVAVSEALTRWAAAHGRNVLMVTRSMLLADSAMIIVVSLWAGGPASPLRYLIILQAVEVTLLASFRTGLRMVIWQSLLVSGMYVIGHRFFPHVEAFVLPAVSRDELTGVVACSWIAAITTAFLAADNERELRRRRYDLEQLARYHHVISEAEASSTIAEEFVRSAAEEFEAQRVVVALPTEDPEDGLEVCAAHGLERELLRLFPLAGSLVADTLVNSTTRLVRGLQPTTDTELLPHFSSDARIVAMSVRTPRGPGVLLVERDPKSGDRVGRRVVAMLERYRDELELRVSNLFLIDSLRTAATTDALTGVANRGRLREALHAATQESVRRHTPLSVIILDVDHFKKVNDVHGHAAGDVVLRQVAAVLKGSVRPYDLVARYGGEEFVVLLPGADLPEAAQVGERLRSTVATSTHPVAVTISLGVARFDPTIDDDDHVIARADELLYEAKQNGRNQVRVASQALFDATPAVESPFPPPVGPPR